MRLGRAAVEEVDAPVEDPTEEVEEEVVEASTEEAEEEEVRELQSICVCVRSSGVCLVLRLCSSL